MPAHPPIPPAEPAAVCALSHAGRRPRLTERQKRIGAYIRWNARTCEDWRRYALKFRDLPEMVAICEKGAAEAAERAESWAREFAAECIG